MKKVLTASLLAAGIVLVTGCASGRSPVNNGLIYSDVKGSESAGAAETSSRHGMSCASNILGLFAYGDASAHTAAGNGGVIVVARIVKRCVTFESATGGGEGGVVKNCVTPYVS